MPSRDAMFTNVISIGPDRSVSDAMILLEEHGLRVIPVLDETGVLLGLFNFETLLLRILPATVEHVGKERAHMEISLDKIEGLSDYIVGRLESVMAMKVSELMIQDEIETVQEDTLLGESIRLLALHGSPIPVLEKETGVLAGLVSSQSVVRVLLKMQRDRGQGLPIGD